MNNLVPITPADLSRTLRGSICDPWRLEVAMSYTVPRTHSAKAEFYLLGHNPGGSPEAQAEATVEASLASLPTKTLNNYLDEAWTTASGRRFDVGAAPLQRRVIWLLEALGLQSPGRGVKHGLCQERGRRR